MGGCFVPGCSSGYRNSQINRLFRPPTLVADKWCEILRKIRSDTIFNPQNRNHRICSLHFENEMLVKQDEFKINGEHVTIDRVNWTLSKQAIPTVFPSVPKSIQPQVQGLRRKLIRNDTPAPKRTRKDKALNNYNLSTPQPEVLEEVVQFVLESWWSENHRRFPNWKHDTFDDKQACLYLLSYEAGFPKVKSTIVFPRPVKLETCVFYQDDKQVTPGMLQINKPVVGDDLSLAIDMLATHGFCKGVSGFLAIQHCKDGIKRNETWFSKSCEHFGPFTVCNECKKLYRTLYSQFHHPRKSKKPKVDIRGKYAYYRKRIMHLSRRQRILRREMLGLKSMVKSTCMEQVEDKLKEFDLPSPVKSGILHSLKAAKVKSMRGMRYAPDWLFESLLLKIKSPAAYRHLREAKILPLPHPITLIKLIASQRCEYGFNRLAMDAITKSLKGKIRRDRQGALIFDEIKLRETLEYNSNSHRFEGYIDYGEFTNDLVPAKDAEKLADHALVIMYRPLNDSWVQPIAAFATKNAASGKAIHKVILEAIIKLEAIGAEVLTIICDGSKPNKSFWKLCGIGEKKNGLVNKMIHPCDENRHIFFSSDVPHLFKCIRNHLRKYTFADFFGEEVDFSVYEKLLQEDAKRNFGLRKCPKLTKSHIWPNSFEKMVVSLATQVFSRSVGTGIEFYRLMGLSEFTGSEATENFTRTMNDMFDALNARLPCEGIRVGSKEYCLLKRFSSQMEEHYANNTGRQSLSRILFASSETLIAMRVTVASTIEMVEYLTSQLGYSYVLTGKINQDCLEKFFGLIRAAGGREEHPTVTNFAQLFRLLSLYNPVKRMLRGNIRSNDDFDVLVSFKGQLRECAKESRVVQFKSKLEIEEMINLKLLESEDNLPATNSLSECGLSDRNIVYYLAGFLCFKAKKFVTCINCIESITAESPQLEFESTLTEILNYGSLHHPSKDFFTAIVALEIAICKSLKSVTCSGDMLLECLRNVNIDNTLNIGCSISGHLESLITSLYPYYITMRLHFYTRSKRNALGHGKATKNKRKESKLV